MSTSGERVAARIASGVFLPATGLVALAFGASVIVLTALVAWHLFAGSALSREKFGWAFLVSRVWDPVTGEFGAAAFLYGTLVTSAIALVIGVPVSFGIALFLT